MGIIDQLIFSLRKIFLGKKKTSKRKRCKRRKARTVTTKRSSGRNKGIKITRKKRTSVQKKKKINSAKRKKTVSHPNPSRRVSKRLKPHPRTKITTKKKAIQKAKNSKVKKSKVYVGEITHFFPKIQVCVLKIVANSIKIDDQIEIRGGNNFFVQKVRSLQIESKDVQVASKGKLVGLKVNQIARVGDKIYRVM